ncbi:MAG TPA: tetratricopeptide repeat protein [Oculatellaceae cyanobacterium]
MKMFVLHLLLLSALFICRPAFAGDEEPNIPNLDDPATHQKLLDLCAAQMTLNPRDYRPYASRASLYCHDHKFKEALLDAQKANELKPHDADVNALLGEIASVQGRFSDSASYYGEAIKLDSQKAFLYANRGGTYIKLRKFSEAQSDLMRAIQLDPKLGAAYEGMAEISYAYGKYSQSVNYCNQALKLDPTDYEAYFYRGCSYEKLGNASQGTADKNKAVKLGYNGKGRFVTAK